MYRSPSVVWVIKSRRLIWAGHVVRMEENRRAFKNLQERLQRSWENKIRMYLIEIDIYEELG